MRCLATLIKAGNPCPPAAPSTPQSASRRLGHAGAEPRQRLLDLALARLRGVAALALLVDDLFRRTREEIGIGELHVDLVDVAGELGALLVEARHLGLEVDDAFERQRRDLAAHDELHGAPRSALGDGDRGEARKPTDGLVPALGAGACRGGGIDEKERNLRAGRDVGLRARRADLRDELDDPAELGLRGFVDQAFERRPRRKREDGSAFPSPLRGGVRRGGRSTW